MGLKSDFNNNLARLSKINEVNLVKELIKSFNKRNVIKAELYHQKYVCFQNFQTCITGTLKRELCDTMLISKHRNYYRLSFIQNKIGIKNKPTEIKIDCGQHFLLTKKPVITINGVYSNILSMANFETITTYGVLYQYNGWDIDIVSAERVDCIHCNDTNCCRKSSVANYSNSLSCQNIKGHVEFLASYGLDFLVKNNFEFGEIINRNSFLESELIEIIKTFTNKEELQNVLRFLEVDKYDGSDYRNRLFLKGARYDFNVRNLVLIDCSEIEE